MSVWIQSAINPANKGAFTKKAKAAGQSVSAFAASVLAKKSKASSTTKRQAALAQTLRKIAKRRKKG